MIIAELWFDVGIKRYTTEWLFTFIYAKLWFDVGIKRYTTMKIFASMPWSCGLM